MYTQTQKCDIFLLENSEYGLKDTQDMNLVIEKVSNCEKLPMPWYVVDF